MGWDMSKIPLASGATMLFFLLSACSEFSHTNEEQIEKNKLLLPPEMDRLPSPTHNSPREQQD
jgi:hypothetical protein